MKKIELHRLFILFSIVFPFVSFAEQNPLTLTVLAEGAKANTGLAIASVFSSADNYLRQPILKKIMPINDRGCVRFIFKALMLLQTRQFQKP